jgi:uncharacterized protein YjbI with pentapeptide repeats
MANPEHVEILKQGVEQWNKWREEHREMTPDLSEANLRVAHLGLADLTGADLHDADLTLASLGGAELSGANLWGAYLGGAELYDANLRWATLYGANLYKAALIGADFTAARAEGTNFADVDLSTAKGLEAIEHHGPSTIGIDTIYKSHGKIPEVFLRGCGVPEEFIDFIR